MSDRFAAAKLVGDQRRRRSGALAPGDERGRPAPDPARGETDPALRSAFRQVAAEPGYIKGYIPGVRENGGQYTHGAIWTTMAFALMGENDRAWELFDLLNPIHHGGTPEQIATYKVEPYVVAADVYAVAPHTGRGGWTWYTGSAGWMYRLLIETLLGVKLEGNQLRLTPRFPPAGRPTKFIIVTAKRFITSPSPGWPTARRARVNCLSTDKL